MKLGLPVKLAVFVVLLFAAVIAACLLWTPLRIKYYVSKYRSDDAELIVRGIRGLLSIGDKGRNELEEILHDEMQNSTVKRRVLLVDALLSIGKDGIDILSKELGGGEKETGFLAKYWARFNEPVKGDEYDRYPLHLAAKNGWKDAAALLLSKGADVNAKTNNGWTPLHWAANNGHKDAAVFLIEKCADVNAKDNGGGTPLHWAAWSGHKDTAELLIEKGADVNAKANDGWTPLHNTARWGHKDAAALLIEKGADVNSRDENGKTPLDQASDDKTKSLLRARGARTGGELKKGNAK
ncbi:MAG: hypothetical protein E3J72_09015 [Planctomycetota bacterium]|nr:MAG: hypothetical protein E3J72_09015 [Planctomycetota bacterium]